MPLRGACCVPDSADVGRHSMGYSIAWLAVRGTSPEVAFQRLALAPTDRFADYAEHDVSARDIPGGWTLVVARGCDHRIIAERQLTELSVECDLLACSIEEHVMYSSSEFWSRGQRHWRVEHDAQKAIDHLSTLGSLPEDFAVVRAQLSEQQAAAGGKEADVDFYFDIPLVLARNRVGFKHDEVNAFESDGKFQVFTDASSKQSQGKAWWQFWR
jgi:hypothetical protein